MIRGTTPTLELNVDGIDLTALKKIVVTLQQQGIVINRQTGDSGLSVSSNVISVHLTQEESLKFKANSDVEIQAKLLSENGEVTATDIERVPVESILNEEVLSCTAQNVHPEISGNYENLTNKIKDNTSRISSLEEMCLQNRFELPINISSNSDIVLLTDDLGNAILAEWSYQIK